MRGNLRRATLLLATTAALWLAPSVAHAQRSSAVQVVTIDSDDAEDQADALTGALKSRIRNTPGWQLIESTNALGPLLMALKCPPKPDAGCLNRIGDQLRVDRFFWGTMSKAPGKSVTVELHLWQRGKPDQSTKDTYSENLRDQNDDALKKIAGRLFDKLAGATGGVLNVRANVEGAQVLVDGEAKGTISGGQATIELSPGVHKIEIRADGYGTFQQTVTAAGAESTVTAQLVKGADTPPPPTPPPPTGPSKPFPTRQVIGWSMVGLGVASGVVGIVQMASFFSKQSELDKEAAKHSPSEGEFCSAKFKDVNGNALCSLRTQGEVAAITGWVFGGVGVALVGVGAILALSGGSSSAEAPKAALLPGAVRIQPYFTPTGGGMGLGGSF
jgi:hypothetical protein